MFRQIITCCQYGWFVYALGALCLWGGLDHTRIALQRLQCFQNDVRQATESFSKRKAVAPRVLHQTILYYQTIGRLFGNTAAENNTLGYCFYAMGDFRHASFYFRKATVQAPERYAVFFNLGMSYYAQRRYNQAQKNFEKAASLLTPEEYFQSTIESPYNQSSLSPTKDYGLAAWHCRQMIVLSHKGDSGHLTPADQQQEMEWDKQLLNGKLFYWLPVREVKMGNNTRNTL